MSRTIGVSGAAASRPHLVLGWAFSGGISSRGGHIPPQNAHSRLGPRPLQVDCFTGVGEGSARRATVPEGMGFRGWVYRGGGSRGWGYRA